MVVVQNCICSLVEALLFCHHFVQNIEDIQWDHESPQSTAFGLRPNGILLKKKKLQTI